MVKYTRRRSGTPEHDDTGERNDESIRHADGLAMFAANIGGAAPPFLLRMASCTWRAGLSRTMPCHPDAFPRSGRRAEGRDAASACVVDSNRNGGRAVAGVRVRHRFRVTVSWPRPAS